MTDWREQAACAGHPEPHIWHSGKFEEVAYALAICARCPVREACGDDRRPGEDGIWGGVRYAPKRPAIADTDTPNGPRKVNACVKCQRVRAIYARGLCGSCYRYDQAERNGEPLEKLKRVVPLDEVEALRDQGMSVADVAQRLGFTAAGIRKAIQRRKESAA